MQHQFIGQFPHRTLIHSTVPDVGQHALRQPMHHLRGVAALLVFNIAIKGNHGVRMGSLLDGFHPLVVDAHRLHKIPLAHCTLFTTEKTRLGMRRKILEHQFFIILGFLLISVSHAFHARIIRQFTIHVIIGFVICTQCHAVSPSGLNGIENQQRLVVHSHVAAAQSQQRTTTDLTRTVTSLLGQSHTSMEVEHGRISYKRTI